MKAVVAALWVGALLGGFLGGAVASLVSMPVLALANIISGVIIGAGVMWMLRE